jgi:hypothetical protein
MNRASKESYFNKHVKDRQFVPGSGTYDLKAIDIGYRMISKGAGGRRR